MFRHSAFSFSPSEDDYNWSEDDYNIVSVLRVRSNIKA